MIVVTGCSGFLGKRVCKQLDAKGLNYIGTSKCNGLDLRDRQASIDFFKK